MKDIHNIQSQYRGGSKDNNGRSTKKQERTFSDRRKFQCEKDMPNKERGKGKRKKEGLKKSRNKIINKEGSIDKMKERSWMILNGSYGRVREQTYIGETGLSIIDYVTNEKAIEEIIKVKEGNRTESAHVPFEMKLAEKIMKKKGVNNLIEKERNL